MASSRIAGIVLAGGKSSRFGRDKARQALAGTTLLQRAVSALEARASEIVVVRAAGQALPEIKSRRPLKVIEDLVPDAGPLGGVLTGWEGIEADVAIVIAGDMPLVQPELISALVESINGYDAVVPLAAGRRQPLCAVYARSCVPALQRRLESGELRLASALEGLKVLEVAPDTWREFDSDGLSFLNINTERDLASAEALLEGGRRVSPPRCEVWLGDRRCGRPATHRTEHSRIYVCDVDASVWGSLYEEVEETDEPKLGADA